MQKDDPVIEGDKYCNMIGYLQFLCHRSRPDRSTAVGILSHYNNKPISFLIKSGKRVFGYLKMTRDYGFRFETTKKTYEFLKFLSHADFAGNKTDRKWRSSWLGKCLGVTFVWNKRRQNFLFLFTCEARYLSLCHAICKLKWIRTYLTELGFEMNESDEMRCDNTAPIAWAQNSKRVKRSKHMDLKNHSTKNVVDFRHTSMAHSNSEDNESDILTKPLGHHTFHTFRDSLCVQHLKWCHAVRRGSVKKRNIIIVILRRH